MDRVFKALPAGGPPPCSLHLGRAEFRGWDLPGQLEGWKLDIMSHAGFFRSWKPVSAVGPPPVLHCRDRGDDVCSDQCEGESQKLSLPFDLIFLLQMRWGRKSPALACTSALSRPRRPLDNVSISLTSTLPWAGAKWWEARDSASAEAPADSEGMLLGLEEWPGYCPPRQTSKSDVS